MVSWLSLLSNGAGRGRSGAKEVSETGSSYLVVALNVELDLLARQGPDPMTSNRVSS